MNSLTPTSGELINLALAAAPAYNRGYEFWNRGGLWCWLGFIVGQHEAQAIDMWFLVENPHRCTMAVQHNPSGEVWNDVHEVPKCGEGHKVVCGDGHLGRFYGISRHQLLSRPDMAVALAMATQRGMVFRDAVFADKTDTLIPKLGDTKNKNQEILAMEIEWQEAAKRKNDALLQFALHQQVTGSSGGLGGLSSI